MDYLVHIIILDDDAEKSIMIRICSQSVHEIGLDYLDKSPMLTFYSGKFLFELYQT